MSHITKIILKVLLYRMRGQTKGVISEEQFGFAEDKENRKAIFVLRMIGERYIEMQRDVCMCYIDYVKAFEKLQHKHVFRILEALDIIVKDLYWTQEANINIWNHSSDWVKIEKGVRQGCVLSPELFSLYTESIMNSVAYMEGNKIGGIKINNLRYADDTAIIAETED